MFNLIFTLFSIILCEDKLSKHNNLFPYKADPALLIHYPEIEKRHLATLPPLNQI